MPISISLLYISAERKNKSSFRLRYQRWWSRRSAKSQAGQGPMMWGFLQGTARYSHTTPLKFPYFWWEWYGNVGPIVWEIPGISLGRCGDHVAIFKIPYLNHRFIHSTKTVGFPNKKVEGLDFAEHSDVFRDVSTKTSPLDQQKITRIDQLQGTFGNSKRTKHTRALATCFSWKSWTWILKWGCYMLDLWTYFTKSYVLR